jgi:dicarboxylate/amino acid:cation (Na+ or H+) symporter, DAACS family
MAKKKLHPSTWILVGLLIGALIGVFFNAWGPNPTREWILFNVVGPIGTAFLRALFMIVVPLVISSLIVGVAGLGSVAHLGRLGWRLGAYYAISTLIAIVIGQILVGLVRPGDGVSQEYVQQARASLATQVSGLMDKSQAAHESLWPGLVSAIVPKNIVGAAGNGDMLAIIFVAILFGMALLSLKAEKARGPLAFFEGMSDACIVIVGWIMRFAPLAVAALVITSVSQFGTEMLSSVAKYVMVVVAGYLIHFFGVFAILVKYLTRVPVLEFYKGALPVIATSFSTSSSNATIPTTIKTLEERFKVPEPITTFSIPLGATVNMNGTALFEAVAALFIAQVFGVEISFGQQVTLALLVLLSAVGVAGVPGGSIPLLMAAMATMGIPVEGIALILGVDRLLDMGRTVLNVTGDMIGALYLAKVDSKR